MIKYIFMFQKTEILTKNTDPYHSINYHLNIRTYKHTHTSKHKRTHTRMHAQAHTCTHTIII
jgi:hypothetical protein